MSLNLCSAKVAVTVLLVVMESWHDPVPEQSPDQPSNFQPEASVAVKVWMALGG